MFSDSRSEDKKKKERKIFRPFVCLSGSILSQCLEYYVTMKTLKFTIFEIMRFFWIIIILSALFLHMESTDSMILHHAL